ncbi:hypothetical protein IE077_001571 [Cardiosporidium cionae]|uniref:Uncharacterized protein n=1 Tax=Cardiosporidium cionae TaxID=476202 RepID=A0ABQ7JCT4_9APIC|nr:hypothetical protein IE077_001571 [Cardiosporidium cionae]|eukprot:KAF8821791.1 hypothetical protein IE077_001571 [Cardiosporidium cionae]
MENPSSNEASSNHRKEKEADELKNKGLYHLVNSQMATSNTASTSDSVDASAKVPPTKSSTRSANQN